MKRFSGFQIYFPDNNFHWDCIILPCLQTQGTVTAVQLQTEAPVVTASGQQVQTLQVVVSSPPCVSVMTVLQPMNLHATTKAVVHDPSMCCLVHPLDPSMSYSCPNCMCLIQQSVFCFKPWSFRLCCHCESTTVYVILCLVLKASTARYTIFIINRK